MPRYLRFAMIAAFAAGAAAAQARAPKGAPAEQKYKAIWEPVPFSKDIELNAISCTGPETCWVAGAKSTIIHTADGGKTWKVQLGGDPEAVEQDLDEIFLLDASHGWAKTERSGLLGTTDGANWAALGKVPSTSRALWFVSPLRGMVADRGDSQSRSMMNHSSDGGKSWKRADPCGVETTVDGLARKLGCIVRDIQFVSPEIGFMGGAAPLNMGTNLASFSKTADGGATWTHSIIPDTKHQVDSIHFWSEKEGIVLLASGQVFWTADGGASWTGSANPPAWRSIYASGGGKIVVGVNENGRVAGYSFNGGRTFTSRPMTLPAAPRAVTFPDAKNGYLVGQHGMVYRYRIVPIDYSRPGMIAAPAAGG